MAHALDLVGERWSLLIVRELLEDDQLRYSDLHARLDGCGTNILAARLKTLEQGGVVRRRQLEPPAASWVYELTEYGKGLREVLHVLAHWGARSLGPPATRGDLDPGWLPGALRIALPLEQTHGRIEFRIDGEVAAVVDHQILSGAIDDPEAVVVGGRVGLLSPHGRARSRRGLRRGRRRGRACDARSSSARTCRCRRAAAAAG